MNVWESSVSEVLTDFVYDKPIEITYNYDKHGYLSKHSLCANCKVIKTSMINDK